jgi:hypothetical protein
MASDYPETISIQSSSIETITVYTPSSNKRFVVYKLHIENLDLSVASYLDILSGSTIIAKWITLPKFVVTLNITPTITLGNGKDPFIYGRVPGEALKLDQQTAGYITGFFTVGEI